MSEGHDDETIVVRQLLIVDDDEVDKISLRKTFSKEASLSDIFECSDGLEALNFIHDDKRVDVKSLLVLLDLKMPKISGLEFLKILRSEDSFKDIVVVILSSSDYEKDVEEAYKYNVAGYILKPMIPEALEKSMKKLSKYWSQCQKRK